MGIDMEDNFEQVIGEAAEVKESGAESVDVKDVDGGETEDENPLGIEDEAAGKEDVYGIEVGDGVMEFTIEELKENAKKGLDYDRVNAEYEKLKNSPILAAVNELAKKRNMDPRELIGEFEKREREAKLAELVSGGVPHEAAERLCELEEAEKVRLAAERENKPFEEFVRLYPDVKAEDIDESVWQEFADTNDLAGAYARFENRQLKTKIEMMERNGRNRARSIGAAKGDGVKCDAFLEGLFGD